MKWSAETSSGKYGYSCQTALAKRVNEVLHHGLYYCWFSLEFNAVTSGNTSNPLWIYQTLSHAVHKKDVNDPKIMMIKMALMEAVTRNISIVGPAQDNEEDTEALINVRDAEIEMFHPQVWRIELSQVGRRVKGGFQYPDERKVEDLKSNEFSIVVD